MLEIKEKLLKEQEDTIRELLINYSKLDINMAKNLITFCLAGIHALKDLEEKQ